MKRRRPRLQPQRPGTQSVPVELPTDVANALSEILTEFDHFLRIVRLLTESPVVGLGREQVAPVAGQVTDTLMRLINAAKPLQREYLQVAVELEVLRRAGGPVQ